MYIHTAVFGLFGLAILLGFDFDRLMLALTTIVSLEAIYLSLLIQMTVNKHGKHLEEISEDIEDIQEDIQEDENILEK